MAQGQDPSRLKAVGAILLAALFLPLPALAGDTGIRGRAAYRGVLVEGVTVFAFRDAKGEFLAGEAARSAPTAADGTYRLDLAPGRYTLVARKADPEGDLFCYYSGSPVAVQAGRVEPVGFNLVRRPPETRSAGEKTRIQGTVTFQGKPLEKLYVYLYKDASDGFRGPGLASHPVGKGGAFSLAVQPGSYFLIARKRQAGGMYGPIEIGDFFNYYPGNPVRLAKGETLKLELEMVTRISQLEEEGRSLPSAAGKVMDGTGRAVAGVRVFAYPPGETSGRPLFVSPPTGEDGAFRLELPEGGTYSLLARERFGGPTAPGELYGLFREGRGLDLTEAVSGLVIPVRKTP